MNDSEYIEIQFGGGNHYNVLFIDDFTYVFSNYPHRQVYKRVSDMELVALRDKSIREKNIIQEKLERQQLRILKEKYEREKSSK